MNECKTPLCECNWPQPIDTSLGFEPARMMLEAIKERIVLKEIAEKNLGPRDVPRLRNAVWMAGLYARPLMACW